MAGIRPFGPEHVADVARLHRTVFRPQDPDTASVFEAGHEYLRSVFLASPLSDPSLPSLVCEDANGRAVGFMVVATVLFGIIAGRLAVLQLQQGEKFLKQAEGNRLRIIPYTAPRGDIKDRHGRVMASNRLSYSLALYPDKMSKAQVEDVIQRLGKLLAIDADEVRKKVEKLGYHSPHPIKVKHDLDGRTIAWDLLTPQPGGSSGNAQGAKPAAPTPAPGKGLRPSTTLGGSGGSK